MKNSQLVRWAPIAAVFCVLACSGANQAPMSCGQPAVNAARSSANANPNANPNSNANSNSSTAATPPARRNDCLTAGAAQFSPVPPYPVCPAGVLGIGG